MDTKEGEAKCVSKNKRFQDYKRRTGYGQINLVYIIVVT